MVKDDSLKNTRLSVYSDFAVVVSFIECIARPISPASVPGFIRGIGSLTQRDAADVWPVYWP